MKLRQKLTLGLCAFYLVCIIGVALNMHFCGGRLAAVRFADSPKCGSCKEAGKLAKESSCCKDKSVEAKIKDSHETGVKVNVPKSFSLELFIGPIFSGFLKNLLPELFRSSSHRAPPRTQGLALHVFNCVFRN